MYKYKRILLKLSGEALASADNTIDIKTLNKIITVVKLALDKGIEIAIVVGGGNIFRGRNLVNMHEQNGNGILAGINHITADHMGMLATVINAIAIADIFKSNHIDAIVMSGFAIGGGVCDAVDHNKARQALGSGKVVIFSAGTGSACFTTDTAAVLRGIEIKADIIFKATKVDGVYTDDPIKNINAHRYQSLSFDEAIDKNLKIMDMAAFVLCREHNLKICVFNMLANVSTFTDILNGRPLGTIIS